MRFGRNRLTSGRNNGHRIGKDSFGVYRPLTSESVAAIRGVLDEAVPEIDKEIRKMRRKSGNPMCDFMIKGDLGVTFLPRHEVAKKLAFGGLGKAFNFGRMMALLENHVPEPYSTGLVVPLSDFAWFPPNDRRLGAYFARNSDARQELAQQAGLIRDWMQEVGGGRRRQFSVRRPDHVTLVTYGIHDEMRRNTYPLDDREQLVAERLCASAFAANGVDTVTLGSLVVGDSYSAPKPGFEIIPPQE